MGIQGGERDPRAVLEAEGPLASSLQALCEHKALKAGLSVLGMGLIESWKISTKPYSSLNTGKIENSPNNIWFTVTAENDVVVTAFLFPQERVGTQPNGNLIEMPKGWKLATDSSSVRRDVIGRHPWGTNFVIADSGKPIITTQRAKRGDKVAGEYMDNSNSLQIRYYSKADKAHSSSDGASSGII